jgi:hypothetical protein
MNHVLTPKSFQSFCFLDNQNPMYENEEEMKGSDGKGEIDRITKK